MTEEKRFEAYTHSNGEEMVYAQEGTDINEVKKNILLTYVKNMPSEDYEQILDLFDLHVREVQND